MDIGILELIALLVVVGLAATLCFGHRPRPERFLAANGLEPRPADLDHVRAVLARTRVSRSTGGLVGLVLGGLTGASLGGPGALAGAGIGLLAGTMLGVTLAQARPAPPTGATRTASLALRDAHDYLPRHARAITLGLAAIVVADATVAMTTAIAPLGRTVAIFVVGLATLVAIPIGQVFQRRTVELRRPDGDAESTRVDDALRAMALRGIHHATVGVLMCGLLLVGYGTVATQGVEGVQVRNTTVVSAPPLSHGLRVDEAGSSTARRVRWIEPDGSHHSVLVPARIFEARDLFIGTIVEHPVLYGIGAWSAAIGFLGALIEWARSVRSWRRPQATPAAHLAAVA